MMLKTTEAFDRAAAVDRPPKDPMSRSYALSDHVEGYRFDGETELKNCPQHQYYRASRGKVHDGPYSSRVISGCCSAEIVTRVIREASEKRSVSGHECRPDEPEETNTPGPRSRGSESRPRAQTAAGRVSSPARDTGRITAGAGTQNARGQRWTKNENAAQQLDLERCREHPSMAFGG